MFVQRNDLGVRTAGEKAQLPDEFLTRSQLVPGTNITFTYEDNWDIRINALTGSGTAGDRDRIISGNVVFSFTSLAGGVHKNNAYFHHQYMMRNAGALGYYHGAVDHPVPPNLDSSIAEAPADARRFYGSLVFADIAHNWNLPNKDNFLYSLIDKRSFAMSAHSSVKSIAKIIAIDKNRVRIYVTLIPPTTFSGHNYKNWIFNNSDIDVPGAPRSYPSLLDAGQPILYRFTLQEGGIEV